MQVRNPEDKEITCIDCGEVFWFTKREQEFYKEREFSEPKRCRDCRAKKKAQFANKEGRKYNG